MRELVDKLVLSMLVFLILLTVFFSFRSAWAKGTKFIIDVPPVLKYEFKPIKPKVPKAFPRYKRCTVNGVRMACYNAKEIRLWLNIWASLQFAMAERALHKQHYEQLQDMRALAVQRSITAYARYMSVRYYKEALENRKKKEKALAKKRARERVLNTIAWSATMGVVVATSVIIIIAVATAN